MSDKELNSVSAAPCSLKEQGAASFSGHWAFRLDVPIVWSNMAVGPSTKGVVCAIGRVERRPMGHGLYAQTFSLCDVRFPRWHHTWNTTPPRTFHHQLMFSDSVFDDGNLPPSQASIAEHVIHGPGVERLASNTVAIVGGLRTVDAAAAPWCSTKSLSPWVPVDDDINGTPGITAVFDQRGEFSPVSADMHGATLVSQVGIGFRMRFTYEVRGISDDRHWGTATPVPSQTSGQANAGRGGIWPDVRVLWAEVATPKRGTIEPAKAFQLEFLNRFINPSPDPAAPATITFVRVAQDETNQRIREVIS